MYDTVLLPTDGSSGTATTLEHALDITANHGATLHGLYVINKRLYLATDSENQQEVVSGLREEGEAALAEIEAGAAEAGVDVTTAIRDGVPHRDILEYAEAVGADLIVMGTHGRTGRDRIVSLGSVTERVVKNAEVPVLTVRIGEAADSTEGGAAGEGEARAGGSADTEATGDGE